MSSNNSSKLLEYLSKSFIGMVCKLHCLLSIESTCGLQANRGVQKKRMLKCVEYIWREEFAQYLLDLHPYYYMRLFDLPKRHAKIGGVKKSWNKFTQVSKNFGQNLIDPRTHPPQIVVYPAWLRQECNGLFRVVQNSKHQRNMEFGATTARGYLWLVARLTREIRRPQGIFVAAIPKYGA